MTEELPLPPEDKQVVEKPKNIYKILTIVFAILLIITIIKPFSGGISEGEVKTKTEERLNSILELQGAVVTVNINDVTEENDLYKMTMDVGGQVMDMYATKDGSLLFTSVLDMEEPLPSITGSTTQEIPKAKTPEVKLFVMSQCPFGTIAEAAIKPVLDLIDFDFTLYFIATAMPDGSFQSLHGQPEVDGDIRQLCAAKYYPDTYMDYIMCVNKDYQNLPWEECSKDMPKIKECFDEEGKELLSENIKEAQKLGVGGSPTLIINDATFQGQRTVEGYKQAVCNAFNTPPDECDEVLSTQEAGATGSC